MAAIQHKQLDEDMNRLDVGIRQLKVQYDMFRAGALKTEPRELRGQLEAIIRKYANNPIGKYAQRFRLNALVSRFNSFAELWDKRLRAMEEGDFRPAGAYEKLGLKERLVARCRIVDTAESETDLRRLHSRFIDAQRRTGVRETRLPSYESFLRSVSSQTERLRREAGCKSVELRLIERDETVQLKARPAS